MVRDKVLKLEDGEALHTRWSGGTGYLRRLREVNRRREGSEWDG